MRVWKSVGAVAVYSPVRATAIGAGVVVVVAGAGFGLGALLTGDGSSAGTPVATADPPPAVTQTASQSDARGKGTTAAQVRRRARRAYARGFAAGSRRARVSGTTLQGAAALRSGGPFVVRVGRASSNGAVNVIQAVRLELGKTYYLCSGGAGLCIASGN